MACLANMSLIWPEIFEVIEEEVLATDNMPYFKYNMRRIPWKRKQEKKMFL